MKNLQKKIELLLSLYKSKDLSRAELLNKKLMSSYPKVIILYNILGLILTERGKINEAIKCYEDGIKIKPDYAMIYNNLGTIYELKKDYTKAEDYYKKSISLDNKISEPQNNLGNLYLQMNKHQKAIICYKEATSINPKFFIAHYNLGVLYKNIGKFEEAKKCLNKSIKLNVHLYSAHRTLSQINKYTLGDDHFASMKKLYDDSKINNIGKSELAFALGKASEDIKDFNNAFIYFSEGNKLRRKNINFSINNEKREFANIKKTFNKDFFKKFKQFGNLDFTPIFILGMPRSGTTLVEQILSSHPKVFGGDELNFLTDLIGKYIDNKSRNILLENLVDIDVEILKNISREYINNLKKISDNSERVTDKLPINFKWIGLIKILLPNSQIIHCKRNPKDNCLSIFKNYFTSRRLNFAYSLNEISEFYNLYHDLMNHWKNILPKFIFEIKYEKIINNPKKEIRILLESCNLDWNENCLKFYNNKRLVKTASDVQIRKKIYTSSVNIWKNYEKHLKKIFEILPD